MNERIKLKASLVVHSQQNIYLCVGKKKKKTCFSGERYYFPN